MITEFPDLIESPAASAVTLGRDSKIIPNTPKGVGLLEIFKPLGLSHSSSFLCKGSAS